MNKIKVNMAVEPNDIQTLHCSQYDTEERKFSVDLHENGVGVSPSSISNQLVYKSFKGGTEQILPSNTSTPSTSPIIADIQYKDGLREDEEFLYRESPSDVDGYAKIKEIRGNTLVWNQLVQNGNFADTSIWAGYSGATISVSNNIATVGCATAYGRIQQNINFVNGHKYLIFASVKKTNASDAIRLYYGNHLGGGSYVFADNTNWQTLSIIKTAVETTTVAYPNVENTVANLTWQQKNMMIFDLTKMGLDSITTAEFEALFPLPYYAYDSGSLLSFNGSGIKTTGKNLLKNIKGSTTVNNVVLTIYEDGTIKAKGQANATGVLNLIASGTNDVLTFPSGTYILSGSQNGTSNSGMRMQMWFPDGTSRTEYTPITMTFSQPTQFTIRLFIDNGVNYDTMIYPMLRYDGTSSAFEPYEEHYLPLPISWNTGKNVLDSHNNTYNALPITVTDITFSATDNGGIHVQGTASAQRRFYFRNNAVPYSLPFDVVVSSVGLSATGVGLWGANKSLINGGTISANTNWGDFFLYVPQGATVDTDVFVQVEMGDTASSYEPYYTHPFYFPTGLKSAGSIYDQLDETGYITRVGKIVLDGTQTIIASNFQSTSPKQCRIFVEVPNVKGTTATSTTDTGIISSYLVPSSNTATYNGQAGIHRRSNGATQLCVSLGADGYDSGITTEALFNQYLASHPLTVQYEIATPLENYGVVDLGSLSYYIEGGNFIGTISDLKQNPYTSTSLICSKYITSPTTLGNMPDKSIRYYGSTNKIIIKDSAYNDASVFKSAMSGVYLLYELNEPKGLTTASIVTNYGEMPLYEDNGELKADCIADVSANNGFQIAKVKLKDENGEIYSNPFQIHIERSPQ